MKYNLPPLAWHSTEEYIDRVQNKVHLNKNACKTRTPTTGTDFMRTCAGAFGQSLNRPDFKYGKGGSSALGDPTTGDLTTEYAGFLTHYSTTGVEEDKAEVFAHLIVNSAVVSDRAARDEVLAEKVIQMKSLVQTYCPAVDPDFWIRAGELPRADK